MCVCNKTQRGKPTERRVLPKGQDVRITNELFDTRLAPTSVPTEHPLPYESPSSRSEGQRPRKTKFRADGAMAQHGTARHE